MHISIEGSCTSSLHESNFNYQEYKRTADDLVRPVIIPRTVVPNIAMYTDEYTTGSTPAIISDLCYVPTHLKSNVPIPSGSHCGMLAEPPEQNAQNCCSFTSSSLRNLRGRRG